ncbi:MAG TPA: helix-turn-helix domain-containing protein [Pirellulaceae bacterium]|nr:helix-turn-helix domain-containing protein [Pirellulaceae bacterium]
MSKKHFTTGQAAEEISVTDEKIRDLIKAGEIAAIDVSLHAGGKPRWRIAASDLEAFLLRRRTQPPATAPKRKKRPAQVTEYY